MILETKETGKFLVAKILPQEANLDNAEKFKQDLFTIIDNGNRYIVLSFERVTYVDSSFLGAMVSSLKYALGKGAEIFLVDLHKDIYDMLHLIRMDKVFKVYRTIDDIVTAS
jgi:anti-sigma B factor antagonist